MDTSVGLNIGDFIATILMLGLAILPLIIVVILYNMFKRHKELTQKNTVLLQQMTELNERLLAIETKLQDKNHI